MASVHTSVPYLVFELGYLLAGEHDLLLDQCFFSLKLDELSLHVVVVLALLRHLVLEVVKVLQQLWVN